MVRGLIHVGVRQGCAGRGADGHPALGARRDRRPTRLGAVAVLMPPDADLDEAARLGGVTEVITDPGNLEAARKLPSRSWSWAAARPATCTCPTTAASSTWRDRPGRGVAARLVPAQPGFARDPAFVAFSAVGGELVPKQITNYRWALSAFGTASAAALDRSDTVYCLTRCTTSPGCW